ncbi:unnamed protein product, partial [marine sediment metagenome]
MEKETLDGIKKNLKDAGNKLEVMKKDISTAKKGGIDVTALEK